MKYLFELAGEDSKLALAELRALFETYNLKFKITKKKNYVLVDSSASEKDILKFSKRSSLIRHSALIITKIKSLMLKDLDKVDWSFVKSPFCVRAEDLQNKYQRTIESKLASPIWKYLENKGKFPEVDLKFPKTTVYFVLGKEKYVCKLIWKVGKARFKKREPMKKPAFHPTSLKPKTARLLVNLSRCKEKNTLLDNFCGMGSVLIEAGIIGCKAIGSDIDKEMIKGSRTNLNFYKIRNFKLKQASALELEKHFKKNSIEAIATDPPYGRSSRIGAKNIKALYNGFLKSSYKVLKKGRYMALLYPHYIKFTIPKKWKIIDKASIYVHGGLTRKVLVLRK